MSWLWLLPVSGALGLVAFCAYVLMRARRVADGMADLQTATSAADEEINEILARMEGMRLTVEVLNPLEVASAESRMAGPVSGVSPGLVRRRLYDQMRSELQQQLSERGIEAQVDILRARP